MKKFYNLGARAEINTSVHGLFVCNTSFPLIGNKCIFCDWCSHLFSNVLIFNVLSKDSLLIFHSMRFFIFPLASSADEWQRLIFQFFSMDMTD